MISPKSTKSMKSPESTISMSNSSGSQPPREHVAQWESHAVAPRSGKIRYYMHISLSPSLSLHRHCRACWNILAGLPSPYRLPPKGQVPPESPSPSATQGRQAVRHVNPPSAVALRIYSRPRITQKQPTASQMDAQVMQNRPKPCCKAK